jgi:hypothetical protein
MADIDICREALQCVSTLINLYSFFSDIAEMSYFNIGTISF